GGTRVAAAVSVDGGVGTLVALTKGAPLTAPLARAERRSHAFRGRSPGAWVRGESAMRGERPKRRVGGVCITLALLLGCGGSSGRGRGGGPGRAAGGRGPGARAA